MARPRKSLTLDELQLVLRLQAEGWGSRRIAEELTRRRLEARGHGRLGTMLPAIEVRRLSVSHTLVHEYLTGVRK